MHVGHVCQVRGVVPRLKCGQAEYAIGIAGNFVKSGQNDRGGRRRGPRHRLAGEYYQMFLWNWSLGSDGILYKNAGHKRETTYPQIKWAVQSAIAKIQRGNRRKTKPLCESIFSSFSGEGHPSCQVHPTWTGCLGLTLHRVRIASSEWSRCLV
jgi:hypothetical protein